jgi:hypothetical protein
MQTMKFQNNVNENGMPSSTWLIRPLHDFTGILKDENKYLERGAFLVVWRPTPCTTWTARLPCTVSPIFVWGGTCGIARKAITTRPSQPLRSGECYNSMSATPRTCAVSSYANIEIKFVYSILVPILSNLLEACLCLQKMFLLIGLFLLPQHWWDA